MTSPLLARLVEVVDGLTAVVDVPALLQKITLSAHDLLSAYAVGVVVRDGDVLRVMAGSGPHPELIGRAFPWADSAVADLATRGRRSLQAKGGEYRHLDDELFDREPTRLAVALTRPDGAGALYVLRATALDADEVDVLELLAAVAGAALAAAHTYAQATSIETAKDLFLATASHELRTPLTVLRGFGETLLNHWDALDDDGRRDIVRTILSRTQAMTGLVEQLLLGSRAGIGMDVRVQQFDLAAAVRVAAASIAGSRPRHPLQVDATEPVMAYGDEATIDAVLGQLVENGAKYCPGGGPISIAVRREAGDAVLRVADTGVGIPAEDLERVFDRFVRSGTARTHSVHGAGLGLWIVRRYLDAQGGRVLARQRDGGGTVIEVRLPAV